MEKQNENLEMTFPNARDCEHGNQRGKCVHCDLAEVEELSKTLHIKIEAQQARIAELREALEKVLEWENHDTVIDKQRGTQKHWPTVVATVVMTLSRTDDLSSLAAHDAEVARITKRDTLVWLYSHCKAIGMTKKSLSGEWDHDIALFTTDLQTQSKAHDAEVRKATLLEAGYEARIAELESALTPSKAITFLAANNAEVKKAALLAIQKLIIDAGCTTALEWIGRVLKVLEEEQPETPATIVDE